ncbi:hypothetical protein SAY86_005314 [Trapa natans]|uniref:Uncharacterized protein n=1 Tax=Trapa natans TaxID=22666 RepID=A0AAN7QTA8_TRANT|nr:hypothetical protein SAY86_005314 [Trapa natans]
MTTMIDDAAAEQLKSQSSSVISVEDGEEIRGHWLGFHSPWQFCFDILGLHPCQTQATPEFLPSIVANIFCICQDFHKRREDSSGAGQTCISPVQVKVLTRPGT